MEQVDKLLKSDDRITAALAAAATAGNVKGSALANKQIRRQSTVTFSNVVVENGPKIELIPEEEMPSPPRSPVASPIMRTKRPIARIPTEMKLKTITHKVKRPAVDIEFHDLVYTVKTASGEYSLCPFLVQVRSIYRYILVVYLCVVKVLKYYAKLRVICQIGIVGIIPQID